LYSITLPVLEEITKNIPSLLIQSDAMIAELAHLENRVNTHLNQLNKNLHGEFSGKKMTNFSITFLNKFLLDGLYPETDIIYFPTMHDNRPIASVFRAAGLSVIDNYDDVSYDLEEKIKIHVEGEVYIRVAQLEEILKFLIDTLGFGSFDLTYTPLWGYFEYILESRITFANKDINMYENKLKHTDENSEKQRLMYLIKEKRTHIKETTNTINNLRNILAKPLYKAAGLEIPHKMKKIIAEAKPVLPTLKPCGELVPYIGETISQLNEGTNLVLNVAPEGCMVSSMGAILNTKMLQSVKNNKALVQHLFTVEGELNEDILRLSLLKILGPENYYSI